jgi:membrane protease YdiL (CAAX protease family)
VSLVARLRQLVWIAIVLCAIAFNDSNFSVAIGALLAIAALWIETRTPFRALGLARPKSIARTLAFGIIVGAATLLFSKILLTPLAEKITGIPRDLSAFDFLRGNLGAYLAILPSIVLGAAIGEEIVFRAFLIGRIEAAFGGPAHAATIAAVVLSSVIFAAGHAYQGPTGILITGTLGLVFAIVYVAWRRNLWFNIVVHGTYDALSLALVLTSFDKTLAGVGRAIFGG